MDLETHVSVRIDKKTAARHVTVWWWNAIIDRVATQLWNPATGGMDWVILRDWVVQKQQLKFSITQQEFATALWEWPNEKYGIRMLIVAKVLPFFDATDLEQRTHVENRFSDAVEAKVCLHFVPSLYPQKRKTR